MFSGYWYRWTKVSIDINQDKHPCYDAQFYLQFQARGIRSTPSDVDEKTTAEAVAAVTKATPLVSLQDAANRPNEFTLKNHVMVRVLF